MWRKFLLSAISKIEIFSTQNLSINSFNPTHEEDKRLLESSILVNELYQHDVLIIATSINFGVPVNLNLYLENILRPNYSFSNLYSGSPQGHLSHLTVHLIQESEMVIAGSKIDFCSPYIEKVFNTLGVTQPIGITSISRLHGESGDKINHIKVAEDILKVVYENIKRCINLD